MLALFSYSVRSYRIRPPTEKEAAMKVSKPVRELRDFESGLLGAYRRFLDHVSEIIKGMVECYCLVRVCSYACAFGV